MVIFSEVCLFFVHLPKLYSAASSLEIHNININLYYAIEILIEILIIIYFNVNFVNINFLNRNFAMFL